jgi:hypothetical protein
MVPRGSGRHSRRRRRLGPRGTPVRLSSAGPGWLQHRKMLRAENPRKEIPMLTAHETDQLVRDIQRDFPSLTVDQQQYHQQEFPSLTVDQQHPASRDYLVIVRNPANGNEVRVTSLKGDWRSQVATLAARHTLPEAEADQ